MSNQFEPDYLVTPGEILQEYMEYHKMKPKDLAKQTKLKKKVIEGVLNGTQPIDRKIAKRLSTVYLRSMEFWMNLENQYQADKIRLEKNDV